MNQWVIVRGHGARRRYLDYLGFATTWSPSQAGAIRFSSHRDACEVVSSWPEDVLARESVRVVKLVPKRKESGRQ